MRSEIFACKSHEFLDLRSFNLCRTTTKPTQVEIFGSFVTFKIRGSKPKSLSRKVTKSPQSTMSESKTPSPQKAVANTKVGAIYVPPMAESSSSKMSVRSSERTTKVVEQYHGEIDAFDVGVLLLLFAMIVASFSSRHITVTIT